VYAKHLNPEWNGEPFGTVFPAIPTINADPYDKSRGKSLLRGRIVDLIIHGFQMTPPRFSDKLGMGWSARGDDAV
jgi:hypothetical protein